ncbi:porin [Gilliamella apicola]|uniref:Porin n=1 Tax=Gilliamella apicola TaxID=1196095 RepID=A0A2V4E3R0_9GAMM|nr:porin [Gilliamella apicola]PXZ04974.1 porin [Gilliamella apicola]
MKRNLLAIAIPALLVAAGANASIEVWNKDGNKVDFYGRVKAANNITDRAQEKEGDDTSARFGMTGQTQITDTITGYGRWDYDAKAGNATGKNEVRYAFAGLNFGDFGSFDYGRNDGVLKVITAYTDVLPQFGGDAADNALNVLSARTKAVATYRNNNLFGITDDISFALQYADNGDNSTTSDGVREGSREAYGAVAEWRIFDTGLTIGGGYAQTAGSAKSKGSVVDNGLDNDDDDDDDDDYSYRYGDSDYRPYKSAGKVKTWAAGIQYDNYNLHLAANYFHSKHKSSVKGVYDDKTKGFELVAQYGIDLEVGRLTPSLAYVQHKVSGKNYSHHEHDDSLPSGKNLVKYVSLGAEYALNKNFSAIVEYKFNLLKKKDIGAFDNTANLDRDSKHRSKPGTKDVLGVGLIYQF